MPSIAQENPGLLRLSEDKTAALRFPPNQNSKIKTQKSQRHVCGQMLPLSSLMLHAKMLKSHEVEQEQTKETET